MSFMSCQCPDQSEWSEVIERIYSRTFFQSFQTWWWAHRVSGTSSGGYGFFFFFRTQIVSNHSPWLCSTSTVQLDSAFDAIHPKCIAQLEQQTYRRVCAHQATFTWHLNRSGVGLAWAVWYPMCFMLSMYTSSTYDHVLTITCCLCMFFFLAGKYFCF